MVAIAHWMDYAACDGTDPELFFYDQPYDKRVIQAKQVCQSCPVRLECLDYAMREFLDYGIWGGMMARERQEARRAAGIFKPKSWADRQPCGSAAAVRRHERHGETLDPLCAERRRDMNADAKRRYRDKVRAERANT